jgi:hypothetical protein
MQILPLESFATATRVYVRGEAAEAPDALAINWIAAGIATEINHDETASVEPAEEFAARRRGRPRKG